MPRTTKIHNVRFYKPKPKAIYCMALQADDKILAVSRSNANVELWNIQDIPFIERIITTCVQNYSIEGLAWYKNRLFSVGLHGLLIEYDLFKLSIKQFTTITGEAAFCLDIHDNHVAIGTELGYLNIFTINDDDITFNKFLDKQEGRILSLKYDNSGEFIVGGGIDAIRIWCVKTGHALHKLTTGRLENNRETIVWGLAITRDFTIISGDSRGRLTFWDGKVGAQISSFQSHKADILTVCLTDSETVLCAGVDPIVTQFVKVNVKDYTKWVKGTRWKIHDHDIRSLVHYENKLYSGGVDGYLAVSLQKHGHKYPPILQNPIQIGANLILLKYAKHIEVWKLGECNNSEKFNDFYNLKSEPQKLVVLQKKVKDRKEGVVCAALSQTGQWILLSTRLGTKLYQLEFDEDSPKLIPIHFKEECCNQALFSNDNLVLAPQSGGLKIYILTNDEPILTQTIDISKKVPDTVLFMTSSECGKYLVVADCRGNIAVWSEGQFYCKIPNYKKCPTAVKINSKSLNLVVTYTDRHLLEYDLKKKELTKFSRQWSKNPPKEWFTSRYPIRNITFDPRVDDIIIAHDDSDVIIIDKTKSDLEFKNEAKTLKTEEKLRAFSLKFIDKYKHLVYFNSLGNDDEMVAVEINPFSFIEQLPPCLVQSTFGRK